MIRPKELTSLIPENSAVLFPGADSVSVETLLPRPKCIILIDGTWDSAKRLLTNSPTLRGLPRAHLPSKDGAPLFRVRRPPANVPGARSTAEAAADAVEVLDGEAGVDAARALRHAVHEASELQLRFVRMKGADKVPHRTERRGYVPGLYEESQSKREGDGEAVLAKVEDSST